MIDESKNTIDSEIIVLYIKCSTRLGCMGSIICGVPIINTKPIANVTIGRRILASTSSRTLIFCRALDFDL